MDDFKLLFSPNPSARDARDHSHSDDTSGE